MANSGRILVAHDLSCRGNASLGIVIPVLTTAGYEVVALPTVLLSSTTDLDSNPVCMSTTNWMRKAIAKFKSQGVVFDAIYTGWLGDVDQVKILVDLCAWQKKINPKVKIFVDPVMGDCGKIYPCQAKISIAMPELVAQADMIFPNPTEVALLLGFDSEKVLGVQQDGLTSERIAKLLSYKLVKKFPRTLPVITSVATKNDIGVCIRFTPRNVPGWNEPTTVFESAERVNRPSIGGTGDLFASLMIAQCLKNPYSVHSIKIAAHLAVQAVAKILYSSKKGEFDFRNLLGVSLG